MNIFTRAARTFQQTFMDYSIMRDIASRMTDVEYAIATSTADKERLREIANAPTSQMSLWTQLYEHFVDYRNELNKYETLKDHYVVQAMIDALKYDTLAIDPQTQTSFDLTIDKRYHSSQKAQRIVNDFRENICLDAYIKKIAYDGFFYGRYWGSYLKDSSGHIVGIQDAYQPGSIFTVGLEGLGADPLYYRLSPDNENRIDILKSGDIVCLDMESDRYRFSLSKSQITLQSKDAVIAQTSTVGRPFCHNIYDKIITLEMLEQMYWASLGSALQRNAIVGVTAPDGLDLTQLQSFTAWYENAINNNDSPMLSPNGMPSMDAIRLYAAEASKIRVIPQQSQRGTIGVALSTSQTVDASLPEQIRALRELITNIKGIPYSFVFGEEGRTSQPSGLAMRQYVRYAREVKAGQDGIRKFLTTIIQELLRSHGLIVPVSYIHVSQYCAVNVAELDRMEYLDATSTVINSIYTTVDTLTQDTDVRPYVDGAEKAKFLEMLLDSISGASQIINVPDKSEKKKD